MSSGTYFTPSAAHYKEPSHAHNQMMALLQQAAGTDYGAFMGWLITVTLASLM